VERATTERRSRYRLVPKRCLTPTQLLTRLTWTGRVLTGDALYCQRTLCAAVVEAGGDYLFTVKANQRTFAEDIRWLFLETAFLDDRRATETVNKAMGGWKPATW
jgi:predicted transposase YbfD/YdcC